MLGVDGEIVVIAPFDRASELADAGGLEYCRVSQPRKGVAAGRYPAGKLSAILAARRPGHIEGGRDIGLHALDTGEGAAHFRIFLIASTRLGGNFCQGRLVRSRVRRRANAYR